MKRIEFDQECSSCKGTGLYQGMAEKDGFAVVCHTCKGTGKYHFIHEYEEFTGRKEKMNIDRVIECNPGIFVGINDKVSYSDFGGMPYKEWIQDMPFPEKSEMRKFTCPCWWYQIANYKLKPDWEECLTSLGGSFSGCKYFNNKDKCWERFDEGVIK